MYLTEEECIITTILGSCISVCLWDPSSKIGGMNHYLLPLWNGSGLQTPRYGNIAIPKLIKKITDLGCKKSSLRAKVFGGADMLFSSKNGDMSIGTRNIILAEDMLEAENIPVISNDVGGNCGRKIEFNTKTGVVMLRRFKTKVGI
ncbi:MAG: chemotaxis protein CheD [Nitrospirae bacterium]|nr:chemotaxis protein CheD [Nitrospirota bacterium]